MNKKGISIIIGYVLLITTSIFISAIVYQWIKTYVPTESIKCPDGVSIFVKESIYNCTNKELNLTLENNGRFNIAGYLIHGANSSNQKLASTDLSQYTPFGKNKGGAVLLPTLGNSIKPGDKMKSAFNLNNTNLGKIYFVEIIPVRSQDRKRVNCADAKIKETLNCI